ncbi:MAG: DUF4437 domain-containing protein [Planctomycetota bacterium]
MRHHTPVVLTGLLAAACQANPVPAVPAAVDVLPFASVEWSPLNPARGKDGPQAANLWGDRTAPGPAGFLVQFVDGFESPPHIHNVSYRGVVLDGRVHNADPNAPELWMSTGSYWTQPKGAVHITSASGERNLAYIEIEDGPYLVWPTDAVFESGEAPINVATSNLAWVDAPGEHSEDMVPRLAHLWASDGEESIHGTLVDLPAGFVGTVESAGGALRAVVVEGSVRLDDAPDRGPSELPAGSTFSSDEPAALLLRNTFDRPCLLYIRSGGEAQLASTDPSR